MTSLMPPHPTESEDVERRNPLLSMLVNVRLSELGAPRINASDSKWSAADQGIVALKFGEGSGDVGLTLHGSAYELRRLSVMLDEAALEIERQWADRTVEPADTEAFEDCGCPTAIVDDCGHQSGCETYSFGDEEVAV